MIGLPLALAACTSTSRTPVEPTINPFYLSMYGAVLGEPYPVAGVNLRQVDPKWWRQDVPYATTEKPGTLVVDTEAHYLYLIQEGGRAMRYGIGVGREQALQFKGNASIGRRAQWPTWTPTQSMIKREPDRYGPYAGGLPGGSANPLGPRALYLYKNGRDTLFRIHGTTEPYTIGTNVSSGCIRLMNQDIIDLYGRVPTGTSVVVVS
ncbi:L,D-transpeptidase [Devosia rhodophyticola]|uniref:L,D-transpeptidase n=1 Tax=Devosia rhodophyticola TaxID=3026423 RepID=A0ABY7Z0B3_9HYPH|nr:L,D-transpeptidase [Devosia rhodophyticola]WDR06465.1 L,D-transpeptidase [Devosia rhodophyticola]